MPTGPTKTNQNAEVIDVDALDSPPAHRQRPSVGRGRPPPKGRQPSQRPKAEQSSQWHQAGQSSQRGKAGQPSQWPKAGKPSQRAKAGQPSQRSKPGKPSQRAKAGQPSQEGPKFDPDDLSDPAPDIVALFRHYNRKHFANDLDRVYVEYSKRMTLCAGTCTFRGRAAGCRIALSEPLLKLRPPSDLRSTLLHEMIHAHLFARGVSRDGPDGHGPLFMNLAAQINAREPAPIRVTPYHTFAAEVDHYRTHHWKCVKCAKLIKRAMNRAPAPRDPFWSAHQLRCGGAFEKVAEPPKKEKQKSASSSQNPSSQQAVRSRPVAAVAPGTPASQLPTGVVHAMRIDHMLANRSAGKRVAPATVECPVCTQPVAPAKMNEHLDACISADFADSDEVQEVPPTGGAPPLPIPQALPQPGPSNRPPPSRPPPPSSLPRHGSPPKRRRVSSPPPSVTPRQATTPSKRFSQREPEKMTREVLDIIDVTSPPPSTRPPPLQGSASAPVVVPRFAAQLAPFAAFVMDPRDKELRTGFNAALDSSSSSGAPPPSNGRSERVGDVLRGLVRGPSAEERERAARAVVGLEDRGRTVQRRTKSQAGQQSQRGIMKEEKRKEERGKEERRVMNDEIVPKKAAPAEIEKVEMGNCPICNVLVAKSELQVHVNRCLDGDAELTRELTGGSQLGQEVADETAECPVCNVSVKKTQLEAHVTECLAKNEELMNEF